MRHRTHALAWMIIRDELKLDFFCAMSHVVSCPAAALQRKPLLTSDKHPQRRNKLPIPAQPCNCLPTQTSYGCLKHHISTMNCESGNWLLVYLCPDLHNCGKRFSNCRLQTYAVATFREATVRLRAELFMHINVRNDYKLLHEVQVHLCVKQHVYCYLPCTDRKPDGWHTRNNVLYAAILCCWVRSDYKILPTCIIESTWGI